MSLSVYALIAIFAILANNVRESEAGCCCCHCCKCCSCCTPCCNPPLLIKLPRTCPCCCKCCCPCCCCGGGGRKRRDVRLLWKRAVPFPQIHLPGVENKNNCICISNTECLRGAPEEKKHKRETIHLQSLLYPAKSE